MITSDATNITQASQKMLEQHYMSIADMQRQATQIEQHYIRPADMQIEQHYIRPADMQTQASPEELSGTYLYADNTVIAFVPDIRSSIKRNCANCGAPLYGLRECSYCGTYN